MVKETDRKVADNIDKLETQNASATFNRTLSSPTYRSKDEFSQDDVIVSLSDAYENRRARQVTEWERGQRVATAF